MPVQCIHLCMQGSKVTVVHDDVMRMAQALLSFCLSLHDGLDLGFRHLVALHRATDLNGLRGINNQNSSDQIALRRLHQQRRYQQCIG
ncbi:hypothetical protein SAMN05216210_0628 [Halopseudomonas salegens]|uniref:Uncharacterized protein n=1 Tax=Halopseudomonas salegens TaxID=1434072 RepID=A0A1H2EDY8_9GAMM|nr:hypothetical protein SAMN05216210_0628 [Halopseudomonas salegens]